MTASSYLLATRSAGKLRELRPLFAQYGLHVIDLNDARIAERSEESGIECFETFEENARAKSEYFFALSGLPTFADDSGLAVALLKGRPGVYSKRWSGRTDLEGQALDDANNEKLLHELALRSSEVVPTAEYVCAAAFTDVTGTTIRLGETTGTIIAAPRGTSGFGYDPYFLSDELGITFGEAETAVKNTISHRGRAFATLLATLGLENFASRIE